MNGNRPRTTSEGLGEVSDVALKRKIRNRLQDAGETIFVQSDDRSDDGAKSLSDRFNTYLKTLPKEEQKQKNLVFQKVCEQWLDVRAFGQVFAFKKAKDVDEVSLGVRGPVSIQAAFSVEPIAIDDVQITKSVNSETTDTGKKSSDTMGMKYRGFRPCGVCDVWQHQPTACRKNRVYCRRRRKNQGSSRHVV